MHFVLRTGSRQPGADVQEWPSKVEGRSELDPVWRALFWICLALFLVFLFSLPVFPTGDGPLHIYMANVFWSVATHTHSIYAHYYAIRHLLQPYSFHYYFLIGLEHFVSADMAEKFFVALILITMATGFRALARSFKIRSAAVSLWVFPLLLNWTLGGGMLNFSFAAGLMLWGLAFYYRLGDAFTGRVFAGFVVTLILLILSHPVPLMLLILMIAGDLFWLILVRGPAEKRRWARVPRWQAAALLLAAISFIFPLLIADKAQMESSVSDGIYFHTTWVRFIVTGLRLGLMYVNNPAGWLYLGLLTAMAPAAAWLLVSSGWWRRMRDGASAPADRLLISALLFLLLSCFFPEHMNGSALFADRMWILVWLLVATCAAAAPLSRRMQTGVAVAALGTTALALILALLCIRPAAIKQQQLADAPIPSGERGIFLQANSASRPFQNKSTYPINYWAGARGFFAHQDVMLNTPWLNLTIVPVKAVTGTSLMGNAVPGGLIENPMEFSKSLSKHDLRSEHALDLADFILYSDPVAQHPRPVAEMEQMLGSQKARWICSGRYFYAVCLKKTGGS